MSRTELPSQTGKNRELVEQVKSRIELCYAEPVHVGQLASELYVSVSHLQHTFKRLTGCGVTQYLIGVRMEKAKEILQSTCLPICEVASAVGFSDYNYFSRAFRKYTGQTPTLYRQTGGKKIDN